VQPVRTRERRRVRWTASLAVLVLVVLGFAGYKFASGADRDRHASAAASPSPPGGHASSPPATAPAVQGSPAPVSPATSPPPSASPPPVQALAPASVAAFGPAGTADGDNPQIAALALAGNPATPWYSQWYATPEFAAFKVGTGLLVDMGRPVTVSSVRVWLTSRSGAGLQLRAGSRPVPSWLPRVASAADAGGAVPFQLGAPVHVRYLLIWFTTLPPDGAGTYQASVYKITVEGQAR
jgi:hypothetical protein